MSEISVSSQMGRITKWYREKCLKHDADIETRRSTELWTKIKNINQGFVIFDHEFKVENFNFEKMLVEMEEATGIQFMYRIEPQPFLNDNWRAHFTTPSLLVESPEFYVSDKVETKKKRLVDYVLQVIKLMNKDNGVETPTNLRVQIEEIVNFDQQIADKLLTSESPDTEVKEQTIIQLKIELNAIKWDNYFRDTRLLSEDVKIELWKGRTVVYMNGENKLKLANRMYIRNKRRNRRLMINYFFVRFILHHVPYLDQRFVNAHHAFHHFAFNVPTPSLETFCYNLILRHFGLFADHLYAKQASSSKDYESAKNDGGVLKSSILQLLGKQTWMTRKNRIEAVNKAHSTILTLGINKNAERETMLDQEFRELYLAGNETFLKLNAKLEADRKKRMMNKIVDGYYHKPIPDWPITDVKATNILRQNRLFVPNTLLRPPFYDSSRPLAVRYGLFGFLFAREFLHGFDRIGSQFNLSGAYAPWWDSETLQNYTHQAENLIKLYSRQVEPLTNKRVDGERTLNQNIADGGAIRVAFDALVRSLPRTFPKMHNYEKYTSSQLFFISIASASSRSSYSREQMNRLMRTGNYAPDSVRVNTLLQNYDEFARAFGCAMGTPMNPTTKHTVWYKELMDSIYFERD